MGSFVLPLPFSKKGENDVKESKNLYLGKELKTNTRNGNSENGTILTPNTLKSMKI